MSSNEPVKNGCEVIYEIFHISNCGFEIHTWQYPPPGPCALVLKLYLNFSLSQNRYFSLVICVNLWFITSSDLATG